MARFKFKLLRGSHHAGTPDSQGQGGLHFRADGSMAGNVIDTDQDLRADDPRGLKFQLLSDSGREEGEDAKAAPITDRTVAKPQARPLPHLKAMSEKAIRDFAAAEEIDLGDAKTKEQMIAAVEKARG